MRYAELNTGCGGYILRFRFGANSSKSYDDSKGFQFVAAGFRGEATEYQTVQKSRRDDSRKTQRPQQITRQDKARGRQAKSG